MVDRAVEYIPLSREGQRAILKHRQKPRSRVFQCFVFAALVLIGIAVLFLSSSGGSGLENAWLRGRFGRQRDNVFRGAGRVRPISKRALLSYKTGQSVIYERFPIQLIEPRPDIPNRVIYSDSPARIGEHQVIDIFANASGIPSTSSEAELYHQIQVNRSRGVETESGYFAWKLDRFKFAPMTTHAFKTHPRMKWYIFADGDTYLFWSTLMLWLDRSFASPERTSLFLGFDEYFNQENNEFFAHAGAGYIFSRKLMEDIHADDPDGQRMLKDARFAEIDCGDCALGLYIAGLPSRKSPHLDAGADLFHKDAIDTIIFRPRLWHTYLLSLHHNSPEQLTTLRQWERHFLPTLPGWDGIRQCDALFGLAPAFLRDPLLAYVNASRSADAAAELAKLERTVVRMDWRGEPVDSLECDARCMQNFGGAFTVENCGKVCDAEPHCFGWQLLNKTSCSLAVNGFRLGRWSEDTYQRHIAGWRIDRIAELELRSPCADVRLRREADERGHGLAPGPSDVSLLPAAAQGRAWSRK